MKILSKTLLEWCILLCMMVVLASCSRQEDFSETSFVGAWKSTRSDTPILLYANGEWEIKSDEGEVMQYGVWQIVGHSNIMWSYKDQSGRIQHEINPVTYLAPNEFRVREFDRNTTTFVRLGQT